MTLVLYNAEIDLIGFYDGWPLEGPRGHWFWPLEEYLALGWEVIGEL